MALQKRYEIVPDDPDHKTFLAVQDFRYGRDDGSYIEITLKDDEAPPPIASDGWDSTTVWLTTSEATELHAVLASMLGVATSSENALVD